MGMRYLLNIRNKKTNEEKKAEVVGSNFVVVRKDKEFLSCNCNESSIGLLNPPLEYDFEDINIKCPICNKEEWELPRCMYYTVHEENIDPKAIQLSFVSEYNDTKLYRLNQDVPQDKWEEIRDYFNYYNLNGDIKTETISKIKQGWFCEEKYVDVVEEILEIKPENTVYEKERRFDDELEDMKIQPDLNDLEFKMKLLLLESEAIENLPLEQLTSNGEVLNEYPNNYLMDVGNKIAFIITSSYIYTILNVDENKKALGFKTTYTKKNEKLVRSYSSY